jgi:hypothetical protein
LAGKGRPAPAGLYFFFFGAGMIDSGEAFDAAGAAEGLSFFFFGFFTSLFPRIWPLAMIVSYARRCGASSRIRRPGTARAAGMQSAQILQILRGHLAAFAIGDELEAHLLPFAQLAQAGTFHGADMDEGIFTAIVGRNETETLLAIEPLHGSLSHGKPFHFF